MKNFFVVLSLSFLFVLTKGPVVFADRLEDELDAANEPAPVKQSDSKKKKKKNLFQSDPSWGEPKPEKRASPAIEEIADDVGLDEVKPNKKTKKQKSDLDELALDEEPALESKAKDSKADLAEDSELDAGAEESAAANYANDFSDQSLVEQAQNFERSKQIPKATDLLWKNIDKLGFNGMDYIARLHLKAKEPQDVLRITSLMSPKFPKAFEPFYYSGKAYVLLSKIKDATIAFNKAIELNKNYIPAYNELADVYEMGKNYYEMRLIYQDLIQMKGARAEFFTRLCEINAKDGVNDIGLEDCNKAIAKNKSIASNFVYRGQIILQSGEREKGIKALIKAASDFPESELAQFTIAEVLRNEKRLDEAREFYLSCVQANQKSDRCQYGLGLVSYQLTKYEESFGAFKKACFIQGGRKYSTGVREALNQIRKTKVSSWISKFENLSQQCAIQ